MVKTRRIVLDVMKPFEPDMITYSDEIVSLSSVESINIVLIETDKEVQNIKITVEGEDLDYSEIKEKIADLAGAIHSIDMIVAGDSMIESKRTPQDFK